MSVNDKPFACKAHGCNQKFVTEDTLAVHSKKHDLSLDHLLNTPALMVPDQTPTPTTFFRDCDKYGLFQDIHVKNPFDESFRKAADGSELPLDRFSGDVETPSLPMLNAGLSIISTPTVNNKESLSLSTPSLLGRDPSPESSPLYHEHSPTQSTNEDTLIEPALSQSTTHVEPNVEQLASINSVKASKSPDSLPTCTVHQPRSVPPAPTPISTTLEPLKQPVPIRPIPPEATPQTQSRIIHAQPAMHTLVSQDGQWVIQFGNGVQVPCVLAPPPVATVNEVQQVPCQKARLQNAKQLLKKVLTRETPAVNNVPTTMSGQVRPLSNSQDSEFSVHKLQMTNGKRSQISDEEVEDEESSSKLTIQERNRMAAKRCRQKKKHKIQTLEQRANQSQAENIKLQSELAALKLEMTELKSLFIEHKNCSVTKKQIAEGRLTALHNLLSPDTFQPDPAESFPMSTTKALSEHSPITADLPDNLVLPSYERHGITQYNMDFGPSVAQPITNPERENIVPLLTSHTDGLVPVAEQLDQDVSNDHLVDSIIQGPS